MIEYYLTLFLTLSILSFFVCVCLYLCSSLFLSLSSSSLSSFMSPSLFLSLSLFFLDLTLFALLLFLYHLSLSLPSQLILIVHIISCFYQVSTQYGMRDNARAECRLFEFPPVSKRSNKNETESGRTARGLVLTCVNVPSFVKSALECIYKLAINKVLKKVSIFVFSDYFVFIFLYFCMTQSFFFIIFIISTIILIIIIIIIMVIIMMADIDTNFVIALFLFIYLPICIDVLYYLPLS